MIGAARVGGRFAFALPDLATPPPADAPPPPDPALLDAARAEGEAEGHARGMAEGLAEGVRRQRAAQESAIAANLAEIAASLSTARDTAEEVAVQAAEALAATLLAAMDAALGDEPARRGAALEDAVLDALRPGLASQPGLTLRATPDLAEALAARLPDGPPVRADATLAAGEARLDWQDGARLVSLPARRAAVRAALLAAGFTMGSDDA
jgi:flagellar assembly protein FliH